MRLMLLLLLSVVARLIRLLLLLLVGWMAHWLGCCLLAKLPACGTYDLGAILGKEIAG